MQTDASERLGRGLLAALAKHVQVGGKWVPTQGEREGGAGLPQQVQQQIKDVVARGGLTEPPEVKKRKFQTKDTHPPTEAFVKKVWDETAVPLMKEAGASDDDVKWTEDGLNQLYRSTDRPNAWRLQAATLAADGVPRGEVADRLVRSKYERAAVDTDSRRARKAQTFLGAIENGNPAPEGDEPPKPWAVEGQKPEESIEAFFRRRDEAEVQYDKAVGAWRDKQMEAAGFSSGPLPSAEEERRFGFAEAMGRMNDARSALAAREDAWGVHRILNREIDEAKTLVDEAASPGKRAAALVLRELSQAAFRRDFPNGVTVYRGIRDEDESKMSWRVHQPRERDVVAGQAEKLVKALNENESVRVKADGWTSWTPVKKAAEEFMVVAHGGSKKPSATPRRGDASS